MSREREVKNICWEVKLGGSVIECVDYPPGLKAKQVRKALLAEGYDPNIRVRKN